MSQKKLKVGFIMGGGVSMGAYSAGAIEYVLDALENYFVDGGEYSSCEVDLFTGASAGSVTLALAIVDRLKRGANDASGADLWLKKLWTSEKEGLDIQTLTPNIDQQDKIAILSDTIINDIKSNVFGQENVKTFTTKAKGVLADKVYLGMTMTNLAGYEQDMTKVITKTGALTFNEKVARDAFKYYNSADYRYFEISEDNSDQKIVTEDRVNKIGINNAEGWLEIAKSAIASGAFPAAFPPVRLKRKKEEYDRFWSYDEDEMEFIYSDGGLFNNDPIDHAMHLANRLDAGQEDEIQRVFFFIDPIVGEHKQRDQKWINENVAFHSSDNKSFVEDLLKMAGNYVRILMSQGKIKKWAKTDKVNNQLDWLQKLVTYLTKLIPHIDDKNPVIKEITDDIITEHTQIIETKYESTSELNAQPLTAEKVSTMIQQQIDTIEKKYSTTINENIAESPKRKLLLHLIALIENVAGLRKRQKIHLIGIGANEEETIGESMGGFNGFFNHEWRKYDYALGAQNAYKILTAVNQRTPQSVFKNLPEPDTYKFSPEESMTTQRNEKQFKLYLKTLYNKIKGSFKSWGLRMLLWLARTPLIKWVLSKAKPKR